MLGSYLKIAYRGLLKRRVYSLINIFGLSLGIACCLLIVLFVRDELSFDQFHQHKDRIYRIAVEERYEDHEFLNTISPVALAPMVK